MLHWVGALFYRNTVTKQYEIRLLYVLVLERKTLISAKTTIYSINLLVILA